MLQMVSRLPRSCALPTLSVWKSPNNTGKCACIFVCVSRCYVFMSRYVCQWISSMYTSTNINPPKRNRNAYTRERPACAHTKALVQHRDNTLLHDPHRCGWKKLFCSALTQRLRKFWWIISCVISVRPILAGRPGSWVGIFELCWFLFTFPFFFKPDVQTVYNLNTTQTPHFLFLRLTRGKALRRRAPTGLEQSYEDM